MLPLGMSTFERISSRMIPMEYPDRKIAIRTFRGKRHLQSMTQQTKSGYISAGLQANFACQQMQHHRSNASSRQQLQPHHLGSAFSCFNAVVVTPKPIGLVSTRLSPRRKPAFVNCFLRMDKPNHNQPKFRFIVTNGMSTSHHHTGFTGFFCPPPDYLAQIFQEEGLAGKRQYLMPEKAFLPWHRYPRASLLPQFDHIHRGHPPPG